MPQVHKSCVNMCGQAFPVYDSGRNQIGEILPREYFVVIGGEGGLCALYFMNPAGIMVTGYIRSWEVPAGWDSGITNHPYCIENWENDYYYAFIMRRTMNLYDIYGNMVGSVAAGKKVLCKDDTSGDNNHHYKLIYWAEKRTGGYDYITESSDCNYRYGFVDSGMQQGTGPGNIALYGNW